MRLFNFSFIKFTCLSSIMAGGLCFVRDETGGTLPWYGDESFRPIKLRIFDKIPTPLKRSKCHNTNVKRYNFRFFLWYYSSCSRRHVLLFMRGSS